MKFKKKKSDKIVIGVILAIIIIIVIAHIPFWINTSKLKKYFNDKYPRFSGYTFDGYSYLDIYSKSFSLEYDEYDIGYVKGSEVEIQGKTKFKKDKILLQIDKDIMTCNILSDIVLDCDGFVFRRLGNGYDDEIECTLPDDVRKSAIASGQVDAYNQMMGLDYNNPYEKTDPCYVAYDEAYSYGASVGYYNIKVALHNSSISENMNGCLSYNGRCVIQKRNH